MLAEMQAYKLRGDNKPDGASSSESGGRGVHYVHFVSVGLQDLWPREDCHICGSSSHMASFFFCILELHFKAAFV